MLYKKMLYLIMKDAMGHAHDCQLISEFEPHLSSAKIIFLQDS